MILPEFLQDACTPDALADALGAFLRGRGVADFRSQSRLALAQLQPVGAATPAARAAEVILASLIYAP
jgi:lipid A disaccharide synthetase